LADQLDGVEQQFTELRQVVDHKAREFTELLEKALGSDGAASASAES
jgi:hypothetical protein